METLFVRPHRCFGLIKNHPWRGGNKRTATYIMRTFLYVIGVDILYEIEDMVDMVVAVESDKWKVAEIEDWLRQRSVPIQGAS